MYVDYIIVGQGLAGTLIAMELQRRGNSFLMIDEHHRAASSVVAAGLFTPVTGMRLVLTWRAEEMLAFSAQRYRELEQEFGVSFYHSLKTWRVFQNADELALWNTKKSDDRLAPYIGACNLPKDTEIDRGYGGFELCGSGWVDLKRLLGLIPDEHLRHERFRAEDCRLSSDLVRWRDVSAKGVILCEGFQAERNAWLSRLPFRNAHGELLTLRIPNAPQTHIMSSGVFLLPLGDHTFRVGSTYDWDVTVPRVTDPGKQYLLDRVSSWMPFEMDVLEHHAGIRPIATQRVPVAGRHPDYPGVSVFNGLGSKGVLYAPYYARQLVEHLELGTPLDVEVTLEKRLKG